MSGNSPYGSHSRSRARNTGRSVSRSIPRIGPRNSPRGGPPNDSKPAERGQETPLVAAAQITLGVGLSCLMAFAIFMALIGVVFLIAYLAK
jgi:hypothetical protein